MREDRFLFIETRLLIRLLVKRSFTSGKSGTEAVNSWAPDKAKKQALKLKSRLRLALRAGASQCHLPCLRLLSFLRQQHYDPSYDWIELQNF